MAWTGNLLDLFDHPCLISNVQLQLSLLREVCVRCCFPIPFTELLSVSWKKKFNESVIFMSDLLCCFFCVFEVNSVKILLPLKFQGSELNLFAHANVLNFGLPIHYICWWWCPHPLLEVGCPVNECYMHNSQHTLERLLNPLSRHLYVDSFRHKKTVVPSACIRVLPWKTGALAEEYIWVLFRQLQDSNLCGKFPVDF